MSRSYDIIVWGATGFTGRLAIEYLAENYANLNLAIAGRSQTKLDGVAQDVEAKFNHKVAVIVAQLTDPSSLEAMTSQTKTVLTTVGPFTLHGEPMVASCAKTGTHYVDITGESAWVREMIEKYDELAKKTGATIVSMGGYDSIPSDLTTYLASRELEKAGKKTGGVLVTQALKGDFSGGTVDTLFTIVKKVKAGEIKKKDLINPYTLYPKNVPQPKDWSKDMDRKAVNWDAQRKKFLSPFLMAPVNSRVVRRSHALKIEKEGGDGYGADFHYDEAMEHSSRLSAYLVTLAMGLLFTLSFFSWGRWLLLKVLPSPGQGPDEKARKAGFFRTWAIAKSSDNTTEVAAKLTGSQDPGYGSTSMMVSEVAVGLASGQNKNSGIVTPVHALGDDLAERMKKIPGFKVEVQTL